MQPGDLWTDGFRSSVQSAPVQSAPNHLEQRPRASNSQANKIPAPKQLYVVSVRRCHSYLTGHKNVRCAQGHCDSLRERGLKHTTYEQGTHHGLQYACHIAVEVGPPEQNVCLPHALQILHIKKISFYIIETNKMELRVLLSRLCGFCTKSNRDSDELHTFGNFCIGKSFLTF